MSDITTFPMSVFVRIFSDVFIAHVVNTYSQDCFEDEHYYALTDLKGEICTTLIDPLIRAYLLGLGVLPSSYGYERIVDDLAWEAYDHLLIVWQKHLDQA